MRINDGNLFVDVDVNFKAWLAASLRLGSIGFSCASTSYGLVKQ